MSENIWDNIQKWYSKKGISTQEFFKDNSTEVGRDEMLIDFAYRAIEMLPELEAKLAEAEITLSQNKMVIDMQAAMIEGMRRVVALARLSPDVRIQSAIKDYDKCKIVDAVGNVLSKPEGI